MSALLPPRGPQRVAAVRCLRRALAEEFVQTGQLAQLDPDLSLWIPWLLGSQRDWLKDMIDTAHDEAAAFLMWEAA